MQYIYIGSCVWHYYSIKGHTLGTIFHLYITPDKWITCTVFVIIKTICTYCDDIVWNKDKQEFVLCFICSDAGSCRRWIENSQVYIGLFTVSLFCSACFIYIPSTLVRPLSRTDPSVKPYDMTCVPPTAWYVDQFSRHIPFFFFFLKSSINGG